MTRAMVTRKITATVASVAIVAIAACHRTTANPPAGVEALVSAALKTAHAAHKVVLIEFGASWCTWCKSFNAFVHESDAAPIVASQYVIVNITVLERDDKKTLDTPGGEDALAKWGGAKSGLPFYVFLDESGTKIADSNAMPDGSNVGFPGNPEELRIFVGLFERTAPRLNAADRGKIVDYLHRTMPPSS